MYIKETIPSSINNKLIYRYSCVYYGDDLTCMNCKYFQGNKINGSNCESICNTKSFMISADYVNESIIPNVTKWTAMNLQSNNPTKKLIAQLIIKDMIIL